MSTRLPDHGWSLTSHGVALVTLANGDVDGSGVTGLFHRDRRLVNRLELRIDGAPPVMLRGARTGPATRQIVYGFWGRSPDPDAIIERTTSLDGGLEDRLSIRCFRNPAVMTVSVSLGAGAATIYHLDQEQPTAHDRERLTALVDPGDFDRDPSNGLSLHRTLELRPGETVEIGWRLALEVAAPERTSPPVLRASAASVQQTLTNSLWDLEALTIVDPHSGAPFVAAGAPHFLAVFGRDALMVSLLSMLRGTQEAVDVLRVLAAHQGRRDVVETVEAPGRILHELRIGDMGVFGVAPGTPYYGTVDASALFVVLLAETLRWGADPDEVRRLLPAARDAVEWCRSHVDRLGFVPSIPHETGIANQGWKDSGDSIVRPDGSLVEEQTSLVEVQGYVYDALRSLAELEEFVGEPAHAAPLLLEAERFRQRFHECFRVDGPAVFALTLDARGEPVATRASNVGHLLATGILDDAECAAIAARLLSDDEFSGWGVRTLSAGEPAYNPLGYHVGTVWPHDNAVLLRGLNAAGLTDELDVVAGALTDLAEACRHQLPELLGGFGRADHPAPIPYPSSARPQAWAAAVPIQVATARLGFRPEIHRRRIRLRPRLAVGESMHVETTLGRRRIVIDACADDATVTGDVTDLDIVVERSDARR